VGNPSPHCRAWRFLDGSSKAPQEVITIENADGKGSTEMSNPAYETWVTTD
jgi:hypothetical protein